MKVTVLMDNYVRAAHFFLAEPAFSLFIEVDGKRILLDAGYSDAYLENARRLDVDLTRLDYVVLSHGHLDHTWVPRTSGPAMGATGRHGLARRENRSCWPTRTYSIPSGSRAFRFSAPCSRARPWRNFSTFS